MMIPTLPHASTRETPPSVVGVLLNHRSAWDALAPQMNSDPYKAPPKAPVLYLKPANTWIGDGDAIVLPAGVTEVQVGASLGVVIGRATTGVSAADAMSCVAGYTLVNDITVAHASVYRPPLKYNCRDTFCAIGPQVVPALNVTTPEALRLRTWVNGTLRHEASTADLVRSLAVLIADIGDFMSLFPGDILLAGVAHGAPLVRAGDSIIIEADGLGRLHNTVHAEAEGQPTSGVAA